MILVIDDICFSIHHIHIWVSYFKLISVNDVIIIVLSAIWIPYDQFYAIIEGTVSLIWY